MNVEMVEQGQPRRQQNRRPINRMSLENVLADEMLGERPTSSMKRGSRLAGALT